MIAWSDKEGVWELELAHPPVNEIGSQMLVRLEAFLDAIEGSGAQALIIHSSREGGFSAGADLRELHAGIVGRQGQDYGDELRRFIDRIHGVMNRLDALPITVIGAVHGVCFGGGFELALTCDLLIADRTARFCFPELRLGIIPGFGGIPRLRREVGNAVVRDLILTGRSINAKKAQEVGLVSQVVGRGQALEAARAAASQALLFDSHVTATAKAFVKPVPEQELLREKEIFLELFQRPGVVEALGRFVASRDPMPYLPSQGEAS